MREVLDELRRWHGAGVAFALATVVAVRGSAPREPGAVMAVSEDGTAVGSVSGGCVEAAVYEAAVEVLAGGPAAALSYGFGDEDGFEAGLTCGGAIDLVVRRWGAAGDAGRETGRVLDALAREEPLVLATVAGGPAPLGAPCVVRPGGEADGSLGDAGLDLAVAGAARDLLARGVTAVVRRGPGGECGREEVAVFVRSFAPRARLLVFGAVDYAAAVAELGAFLGFRVTVCDARPVFATRARFPGAHEVVRAWPHTYLAAQRDLDGRTAVCVLTHDPRFDVPVLTAALRSPAGYVGAMGSRRTHEDRLSRLRAAGVREAELARLVSPIGLDLGARTPAETAVSIAAELIQHAAGATGRPLTDLTGAIHRPAGAAESGATAP
ncbi:XdhC family protein [Streptomyces sp. SBT349]|uniref:XdhC family protein n=1 Tax=Streptomyces sp. SBT349 TaxID=1580539 RepID=UPI00066D4F43|nr:XdhC/CoxI family protein [Streptomyces sp. SBT349]